MDEKNKLLLLGSQRFVIVFVFVMDTIFTNDQ